MVEGAWSKEKMEEKRSNSLLLSFRSIIKHADVFDCFLIVVGYLGAIFDGLSQSIFNVLFAKALNFIGMSPSSPNFIANMNLNASRFLYLGAVSMVVSFLEGYCCTITAERLTSRMRARYLKSVMRQDVGYFDVKMASTTEVINMISTDSLVIKDVLSEKAPNFIMNCSLFIGNYVFAFILLWRLALVAFPTLLLLIVPGLICGRVLLSLARKIHTEYDKATIIIEQALSAIRTVYSSTAELHTISAFSTTLDCSVRLFLRQDFVKSLAIGSNNVIFAIYAFIFWYGSHLVQHHGAEGGTVVSVGFCIVFGGQALGIGLSNVKHIVEAMSAVERIMKVIKQRPMIDSESSEGEEIEELKGEVEFKEVRFSYPSRPGMEVLKGLNLMVEARKTMALVGESGSGKSTMISLLQRFYDPIAGEILLDRVNIRKLRLKWLRAQMGLVSQEPVLFATSIKENILFGKEDATMEEIITAAKAVKADAFIRHFPYGYDTKVGERGVQLSGGEKQRIAIARAIIRSPKILLLDEATSTLDTKSERDIQQAIETASIGRTTIVIAHRLSTVRHVDTIVVIQSGQVIEAGSHNHLISFHDGYYSHLVRLQESQHVVHLLDSTEANTQAKSSYSHVSNNNFIHNQSHDSLSSPTMSFQDSGVHDKMESARGTKESGPSFRRLLTMTKPNWQHTILGCVCAALYGLPNILYSYTMTGVLSVYLDKDKSEITTKTRTYCIILLAISVFGFIVYILMDHSFSVIGHYLIKRVREDMLSKMLTFEVGWFDQEENSSGAICSKISKDARELQSLVVDRLSLIIHTSSIILISYIMGLAIAWKFALVMISVQPILIACYFMRGVLLKILWRKGLSAQLDSNKLAMEAVQNIRTITAFSSQDHILHLFMLTLAKLRRQGIQHSLLAGAVLGSSNGINIGRWVLPFWYGGIMLSQGSITIKAFLQTMTIIFRTFRIIAEAGAKTMDLMNGAGSTTNILSILDRATKIEPDYHEGHKVESIKGEIELSNISFSYPSRPGALVLKSFSIAFEAGRSTALVGPSGFGKSTIISLIERFYDPLDGVVRIDGRNIQNYHLRSLRKHIALVGQEPTLFIGTIKENILYGSEGASDAEVEAAARTANAHDFICGLNDGYDTNCGEKGVQLSGGQKQRIAIARAILRNPRILLLDEATSALDGEAEKLVKEALERLMRGKTTVVVAHRLNTIMNCDLIIVLENGLLVEKGNHASLMEMGNTGKYYGLLNLHLGQEK